MYKASKGRTFEEYFGRKEAKLQDLVHGPLAIWAIEEEDKGANIHLEHLYEISLGNGAAEPVAWIGREGLNPDTGEVYNYHQAVCDHLPLSEALDDTSVMLTCPALIKGVVCRLEVVKNSPILRGILEEPPDYEIAERRGINNFDEVDPRVIEAILYLLYTDQAQPELWVGNYRSGSHNPLLISKLLCMEEPEARDYLALMDALGLVESPDGIDIQLAA